MAQQLQGQLFKRSIDGWEVSWLSEGTYRHWCRQILKPEWPTLLVLMFNPGSLSGSGAGLPRDTTLRILREVGSAAGFNIYVINLFDYASPRPSDLFDNWARRDGRRLHYTELALDQFTAYVSAYGNYLGWVAWRSDIDARVREVQAALANLPEIALPKNGNGTPKHPMVWQRQKLKPTIASLIRATQL